MSGKATVRMIALYMSEALPTLFLSGFFQSPPQNYHDSEEVEYDVQRYGEDVAIVVTDLKTGYRVNADDLWTNKKLKPPVFKEALPINAYELIHRMPGVDPFQNPDFLANAGIKAFRGFRKLEAKIRRAVELMASQVLQTGTLTLTDDNGVARYTVDFQPKTSHFPDASVAWGDSGYDPIADLLGLANVIRADGLGTPEKTVFGQTAFENFLDNTQVQARLNNRRMEVGRVAPQVRGEGAVYQGNIWVGNYDLEMWTYDGHYKDPQTGVATRYVGDTKVIMTSNNSRFDLTFGSIPKIVAPDPRVAAFLPPRMQMPEQGFDLTTGGWITQDGETLWVSAGTRPATIPTAIDTYGCLETDPA